MHHTHASDKSMWMLCCQTPSLNKSTTLITRIFNSGIVVTQNCCCCQCLQCRSITTACHDRDPAPRPWSLLAHSQTLTPCVQCFNSLLHCQPLFAWVLRSNDCVYIVLALDTMIEARQQTVSVWWQIHTNNICFLVSKVIQESWVLMCKSVVILLPYIRSKDKVQRSDWTVSRKADYVPLIHLACCAAIESTTRMNAS